MLTEKIKIFIKKIKEEKSVSQERFEQLLLKEDIVQEKTISTFLQLLQDEEYGVLTYELIPRLYRFYGINLTFMKEMLFFEHGNDIVKEMIQKKYLSKTDEELLPSAKDLEIFIEGSYNNLSREGKKLVNKVRKRIKR